MSAPQPPLGVVSASAVAAADALDPLDPLSGPLRQLFCQLDHAGELPVSDDESSRLLCGVAGRPEQGTCVRFVLRVRAGRILQARYRAYGCPYTLATCEWLARRMQGLEAPSVEALTRALGAATDWARSLQIPPSRLGRLLVIEDAIGAAFAARGADNP